MKRVFVIILDGVGVGELPDAADYGDAGSNTLGNLSHVVGGLSLPTLERLGLGYITNVEGVACPDFPQASFGKMAERSPGKDSTTGHWELAGLILDRPFPTYPDGFPDSIINQFSEATGYGVIGNIPASGTEIIRYLGEQHLKESKLIIYTSADSVFQIAAHDSILSTEELYRICVIARNILVGKHAVARVIARPFTGKTKDSFKRTKYRRDFSLKPTGPTVLTCCQQAGISTVGIGKVNDLYAGDGIDAAIQTKTNQDGMQALSDMVREISNGLIMTNLVDFDMLWGHRNDPTGFQKELEIFDQWLQSFLTELKTGDILMITADHGNDPTTVSTDHSREYVPLLIAGHSVKRGVHIGTRTTFSDLSATITDYFGIPGIKNGESFLQSVWK